VVPGPETLGEESREKESVTMNTRTMLSALATVAVLSGLPSFSVHPAHAQLVFQAAGPTAESIQGTVDAFRAALGEPNNGNGGPQASGRREINWDGGGSNATTPPVTPFDVFLNTRGARFTTRGAGLSQAPPSGLVGLFNNPTYANIFTTFSAPRLFTPVGSRITEGFFFVPGTNGGQEAVVTGFGAIFTDVDTPTGETLKHDTQIEFFDDRNHRIFIGLVPSSPGNATLSFFGIVFDEPRIGRVRITTGNSAPGPGPDDTLRDIVMMDDFFYGEPQPVR
jgi:hypothetical protein